MKRKLIQSFFTFGALLFLTFGVFQLSDRQFLFAEILKQCCNMYQCDGSQCNDISTAILKPNCEAGTPEVEFTCRDCMDAIGADSVCNRIGDYAYCKLESGLHYSSYYGTEYPLSVSISGPSTLAPYEYGTFTANVSGGITPYSYSWQIYYPCDYMSMSDNSFKDSSGGIILAPPCGYWEPLATKQATVVRYDTRDFILKSTVTDSHIYTNSAYDTHSVTITGGGMYLAGTNNNNNFLNKVESSNQIESLVPVDYQLFQNYPNPFNPSTIIIYSLKSPGSVKLSVYDVSGKLVKVLVDENQGPGFHNVSFNGNNLSSGVYIYRLETNDYSSIKKMLLIK